jgi:hypothetical protein
VLSVPCNPYTLVSDLSIIAHDLTGMGGRNKSEYVADLPEQEAGFEWNVWQDSSE